ncbi:hypothetical protein F4553_007632 [Allocatelliglobosispora scoriae]|uniref:Uncharacterized protein n=1 Tax=Allocatelliglobosispora scoriae TaxID=643052 RepID=A0A841C359_9ACTN|nr:hypothetical protein [Allocatelliglobosispora scoriae]MBB5874198.1 hypothetical protein [Allocatelliglobosispora scoriae]
MATVNADAIHTLATKIEALKTTYVTTSLTKVGEVALLPGDFPDGTALKTHVTDRMTELKTALTNIGKAMDDIKAKLDLVANKYAETGDHTAEIAEYLSQLVTSLGTDLPGFEA